METDRYREKSLRILANQGIQLPESLPLIDAFQLRTVDEVVNRILCLNAIAASAYDFDRMKAMDWVKQESLFESLSPQECSFLTGTRANVEKFKVQVEGMWALAWATKIVERFDFWNGCDPSFVTVLPNLKVRESSASLRGKARLRKTEEIGLAVDLAYCLHWCIRQAELENVPLPKGITKYVIEERRRAFEWLISDETWDNVTLDT